MSTVNSTKVGGRAGLSAVSGASGPSYAAAHDQNAPQRRSRGEITTAYVGAFFDQHLRGEHQQLLDGPSTANPEVSFQNPLEPR
ncbi:hypothetical protein [Nonomuraea sp. NPDC049129]|uniref:hypothetical protein n=1 Tax=unclassified Nonomuraea TaxID=2593643 RepID=UPI0033D66BBF